MTFTIFFDPPYWVGVLEEERAGMLYIARHIFGAEPSEQEVLEFVRRDFDSLWAQMTVGIAVETETARRFNPKRLQREVRRTMAAPPLSTKAQEAMRVQIEHNKQERKANHRAEREAEKEYKREVAREKAKAKHRGR
jgi:hypothetical protein